MAVFVDPLFSTEGADKSKWKYAQSCHMTADTHEELTDMATRLALKPTWIQHYGRHSEHFDLTASKRAQAVRLGAIELTREEAGQQAVAKMRAAKVAREGQVTG